MASGNRAKMSAYSHVFWAMLMTISMGFWVFTWFEPALTHAAADLILCIVFLGWLVKIYMAYYARDFLDEDLESFIEPDPEELDEWEPSSLLDADSRRTPVA